MNIDAVQLHCTKEHLIEITNCFTTDVLEQAAGAKYLFDVLMKAVIVIDMLLDMIADTDTHTSPDGIVS